MAHRSTVVVLSRQLSPVFDAYIRVKASKAVMAMHVYLFNNLSPLYLLILTNTALLYMKGSGDTHFPGIQAKIQYYHSPHASASLVYSSAIPLPSMDERNRASCNCTGGSPQTVNRHNSDFVTVFHPDGRIILPCSTFALKKSTLCCNCDFVYRPTVLQLQQKNLIRLNWIQLDFRRQISESGI